ncbi:ferredoxin reductase [Lysobacter korlensis]|uniref:Ferredoxin reductase n=1 Tax=Lysobacter korlensis TaxID=553636 RepID=A0ABV6RTV8_9GAMM
MTWRVGTVVAARAETPNARTLTLEVPDWPGNIAGQHLDLRLTSADGYQASRSYSIASEGPGTRVELSVDQVETGEVSPYLVQDVEVGESLELRGPLGTWFIWRPEQEEPVQLIAGGSGCVPLMAMARAHARLGSAARFRLLYSVRSPELVFYRNELTALAAAENFDVEFVYTRSSGDGSPPGRVTRDRLATAVFAPSEGATVYVCGPTRFVETVATWLVAEGHPPARIRTERFGGT